MLSRIGLKDGGAIEKIKLPTLDEDAVAFIAQNPTRHEEFAIATFKRSAYRQAYLSYHELSRCLVCGPFITEIPNSKLHNSLLDVNLMRVAPLCLQQLSPQVTVPKRICVMRTL